MTQQERRLPPIWRDAVMLVLGSGGIVYQQVTGRVSEVLLAVYVALLAGPAGLAVWSLQRGSGGATTGGSSPSPGPPDSPAPRSSSTSAPGGGDG